jgi:YVTN family beta-propeller protein
VGYADDYSANAVTPFYKAVHQDGSTTLAPGNPIPVGQVPLGIAITPDGKYAYVADYGSNTVDVIDLASQAVVATIPVGAEPYGVAVTPNGSTVYVSSVGTSTVTPIDTATNTPGSPIALPGGGAYAEAVDPANSTLYVTGSGSATEAPVSVSSPFGIAFLPT